VVIFEISSKVIGVYQLEMREWWKHYKSRLPNLEKHEKELVEDITGRVPLLLDALLDLGQRRDTDSAGPTMPTTKNYKEVEIDFLGSPELKRIVAQVEDFAQLQKTNLHGISWKWQGLTF